MVAGVQKKLSGPFVPTKALDAKERTMSGIVQEDLSNMLHVLKQKKESDTCFLKAKPEGMTDAVY